MTIRRATTLRICYGDCPAGSYVAPDPGEPDRSCLACGQPEDHDGHQPPEPLADDLSARRARGDDWGAMEGAP